MLIVCVLFMGPETVFADKEEQLAILNGQNKMVLVKGGCYQMGDIFNEGLDSNAMPVHEVCLDDFYIAKYEVNKAVWHTVMNGGPRTRYNNYTGKDSTLLSEYYPARNMSWVLANKFIRRLNKLTGKNYRLPTEAEWEYAARSGGKKERFAGFNEEKDIDEYAVYHKNSPYKVRTDLGFKPNGLGIYHMSGNVAEWCWDRASNKYYQHSPKINPRGPTSGSLRVVRGGSVRHTLHSIKTTIRSWEEQDISDEFIGFRLAHDGPNYPFN
jgi:formylglycine-generating enzyme required for sulfatase activity